ncbi:MAG: ABC transporter permease [Candidatus Sumerlaeaceae bacterium]|nr:ABC transporter permease [Candidatus Sumerlaeaceae bacterium]
MQLNKVLHIVWTNLAERKARTLIAAFVIAFAVAVVMVVASLAQGFLRGALAKAEQAFPRGALLAKPRTMNIMMLAVQTTKIDDAVVEKIRALPGVEYCAPQLSMKMPLRAEAEIAGQQAVTDAVVVGVDPVTVKSDVKPGYKFDYDEGTSSPMPCVVPAFFLDMYNLAYADSAGLPKVNETFPIGKHVKLYLGESYLLGATGNPQGKAREFDCQIVGMTQNPSFRSGILIPIGYAREFNKWFTGTDKADYNAAHVRVGDLAKLDEVTSAIAGMNLTVESNRDVIEKFRFVVRSVTVMTGAFALIVVAIAAVSIFNTFSLIMTQRRGEVGLLRAVGGTRKTVTKLFLTEVASIGLIGGVIGVAASWPLLAWADGRILAQLPKVSFLPERLFFVSWPMAVACVVSATLVCVLTTLPAILRTTRMQPTQLVSEA